MTIAWDPAKNDANEAKHRIRFERFADMDHASILTAPDMRHSTATEARDVVFGRIDGVLYMAVITQRGDETRIVSLRSASRKERRLYAEATQQARR